MPEIKTRNDQGTISTITSIRTGYEVGDIIRLNGSLSLDYEDVDVRVYWVDDAPWYINLYGWWRFKTWPSIVRHYKRFVGRT